MLCLIPGVNGFLCCNGSIAAAPLLTAPNKLGSQFQFTLQGEADTPYIIETSANLSSWTSASTNNDATATRLIVLNGSTPQGYYRARQASPLFAFGIAALEWIHLNGYSLDADSFDSADPLSSTDGKYDPIKARDDGDVAAFLGLIDLGNARIWGSLATGPGGGVNLGPLGSIGDKSWHEAGNLGIEPGYLSTNFNSAFPEVIRSSAGFTPGSGVVNGTYYDYVLGSYPYAVFGSLVLSGQARMLVVGNSTLRVTGDVTLSGTAYIQIDAGASLKLYVRGTNAILGGLGIISPGHATNFYYYGLANNTNVELKINSPFTGGIYAPNATVSLGNMSGSGTVDFSGACVARNVLLNQPVRFHFDENLKRAGPFY